MNPEIDYELKINPSVSGKELDTLFNKAWPNHTSTDWDLLLEKALVYVCAYESESLIGFCKVVGDGGVHGFLLDPTVDPDWRRRGIGKRLVKLRVEETGNRGVEWVHVDYEARLENFYKQCGFSPTKAGLLDLRKV